MMFMFFPTVVMADNPRIAVIYPDMDGPYARVFEQIIEGIQNHRGSSTITYSVPVLFEPRELQTWVERQHADVIVALGARGVKAAEAISIEIPIVIGAVLFIPSNSVNKMWGISLTPDPTLLYKQLKILAGKVKRVRVVYNPDHYGWLIKLARRAAAGNGLELIAKPARDLSTAADIYLRFINKSQRKRDAIWLLQDSSTVGDKTLLPYILREAWNKKLLIFSSNPGHVRRGALFSLYADQVALGHRIRELAIRRLASNKMTSEGISPLQEVKVAVNLRTAGHLGIRVSYRKQREFDLVFPQK